jgi:hypothetical protein
MIDGFPHQDPRIPPPVHDAPVLPNHRTSDTIGTHPGVVVFLDEHDRIIQTGATSDCKRFVADRLGESDEPDTPSARVTHKDICARILVWRTGSSFESDWLTLTLARALDPALHAQLTDRLRPPVLALDRSTMTWRTTDLGPDTIAPSVSLIAPIRTTDGARALGERADDLYDLCRYPLELAKSPIGTPCVYKDMGKCPAPCDGSEPIETYNERAERAFTMLERGVRARIDELASEIERASADMDFERAATLKPRLDALRSLPDDVRAHARALTGRTLVVVSRATKRRWCILWTLGRSGLTPIATLFADAPRAVLQSLIDTVAADPGLADLPDPIREEFGLVARTLNHKPKSGTTKRSLVLDRAGLTPGALAKALAQSAGQDRSAENHDPRDEPGEDPSAYNTA